MIRLALPNSPYIVPETGLPVEGRMKVFLHDSDEYAHLYTLEGGEYVQAENPQLLHAGLTDSTIFTALGVFDVVIEKYIGAEGQLSVASPDSDFEQVGDYEVGMDFDIASYSRNTVNTMEDMRDVNPELGMVTVKWYAEEGDCVPRTYVWDAECENTEDGGYIVGSDLSDSGKWVLMWDDEVLPCGVYGVKPGTEANVSLLLSYPAVVGSFQMATAPRVRFTRGTYTSANTWSTTKEILFDPGAKFTAGGFACPKVQVIGMRDSYVADFTFTAADAVAHSSWFRTAGGFWRCGAMTMVIDATNYMEDFELNANVTLQNRVLVALGQIATVYSGGASITLDNVVVQGKPFRMASDFVVLTGTGYGDGIFTVASSAWDPGLISAGHHVQFSMQPELQKFESARRWYEVMKERRERAPSITTDTLDFENRAMSGSIDMAAFLTLKNVSTSSVNVSGASCTLENVKADVYVNSSSSTELFVNKSEIVLKSWDGMAYLGGNDSALIIEGNTGIDPAVCAITWNGGKIQGKIWMSDAHADTYAKGQLVSLNGVNITQQWQWRLNRLSMRSCFGGAKVDLLPYVSGSDYVYELSLVDNIFTESSRFWFTMYGTAQSPHTEIAGKVKAGVVNITRNIFLGSDEHPLKMLRWHPFSFTQFIADDAGTWTYEDNTGNCPDWKPAAVTNGAGVWGASVTGPDSYPFYLRTVPEYLFCPYLHYVDGSVDYLKDSSGMIRMGEWIAGFPSLGSDSNFMVLGGIAAGQTAPGDMWDEDLNNMFIVKSGFTIGPGTFSTSIGRLMWPEY